MVDDGNHPVDLTVTANQEPVAHLALPDDAAAGAPLVFSASASADVDGTVVSATLRFGDGQEAEAIASGDVLDVTHTYAAAGLYDVEVAVVDDEGRLGRARARLTVAPPADPTPPIVAPLLVRLETSSGEAGEPLDDESIVAGGAALLVDASASDDEASLRSLTLSAEGPLGAIEPELVAGDVDEAGAGTYALAGTWRIVVPDAAGPLLFTASAADALGRTTSGTRALDVVLAGADADGDGLSDALDPDPTAFHGAQVSLFHLDTFPRDLLQRQMAEEVEAAVRSSVPAFVGVAPTGFLASSAPTGSALDATAVSGLPDVAELYALTYRAILTIPPGADAVAIAVTADDVGVVFLDGVPVASADEEYATDFFRLSRLPADSGPLPLAAPSVPIEILVANEAGPAGWTVSFTFFAGSDVLLPAAEVGQQQFLLP